MMENSIVLHAQDLVAGYIPEVNILNGCDLEVRAGEFVGIIGPNGAGKSTLLKAILGMCKVRSGSISLNGQDITGRKAHELVPLGVGYVPQTKNVFPSLTVKENLEMGCFLKPSVFKDRFAYVAEMFPKLADRAAQRAEPADPAEDRAHVRDRVGDVTRARLTLGPDHRRTLGDPPERLSEVGGATDERHGELPLVDVVGVVGGGLVLAGVVRRLVPDLEARLIGAEASACSALIHSGAPIAAACSTTLAGGCGSPHTAGRPARTMPAPGTYTSTR